MQGGISPEMPSQSVSVKLERCGSLHTAGEINPVMYPVLWARWNIGSSDLPRRVISATWCVSGSQLTPYQLWQQSLPVQELKMPMYGSWRADLKAKSAARSDGGQQLTTKELTARKIISSSVL